VIRYLAEAAPTDAPVYITQILQWGPAGVLIVLILSGVLVTKAQFEAMRKDRDDWRAAYEKECDAHDTTRAALAEATKASVASLEMARTTAALLTNLGHVANHPESGPR
jgi:hypothetical protein